jgi:hypothetical protein
VTTDEVDTTLVNLEVDTLGDTERELREYLKRLLKNPSLGLFLIVIIILRVSLRIPSRYP